MWPRLVHLLLTRLKFDAGEKKQRLKPERIEHELGMIVGGQGTKEDKTSALQALAKRLGLPVHSSDIHCVASGYPELFDRITECVRNAKAERATKHTIGAAWISAATAMVAVIMSIVIHVQTRQLFIPAERPTITIVNSSCKGVVNEKVGELTLTVNTVLKNMGKHPAGKMRIRVWGAKLGEPNNLKSAYDRTCADPLYPEIEVSRPIQLQIKPWGPRDRLEDQRDEIFFYVRTDYWDMFRRAKQYTSEFHLIYKIGDNFVSTATVEAADKFESALRKIGAK
jgi:hypothetical protein